MPSSGWNLVTGWTVVPSCFGEADFGAAKTVVVMVAIVVVVVVVVVSVVLGGGGLSISVLWVEFFCCCIFTCMRLFSSLTRSSICMFKDMFKELQVWQVSTEHHTLYWITPTPLPNNLHRWLGTKNQYLFPSLSDIKSSLKKQAHAKIWHKATVELLMKRKKESPFSLLFSLWHFFLSSPLSHYHISACHPIVSVSRVSLSSYCLSVICQLVVLLSQCHVSACPPTVSVSRVTLSPYCLSVMCQLVTLLS